MDIGNIVDSMQILLWLFAAGIYISRLLKGEKRMPAWVLSNKTLGVVIGLGLLATCASFYFSRTPPLFQEGNYEAVTNRKFINEKVVLDGRRYENCEFTNVTFVYNGTAGFSLSFNTFKGTRNIELGDANRATVYTMAILKGLDALKPEVGILDAKTKEPSKHIQQPVHDSPTPILPGPGR